MPTLPCKRLRPLPSPSCGAPHQHFPAIFELLLDLKPRALRRAVKGKDGSDAVNTSTALVFECCDGGAVLLQAPCADFVEWLLSCMQSDALTCGSMQHFDDDMHLLCQFAEHEGLRRVLLDCSLLPPFICLCFRLYFDMQRQGADEAQAQLWLRLLLLLLFKMCNLDEEGPELVLKSLQGSGADDFAYVVHSLMQAAAESLCSAAASAGAAPRGFMSKCAGMLSKGKDCVGCVAVDLCSLLCCSSPEGVSYAILSQALKPSLVMNLTLLLFQRLSSTTVQLEHERLAVSWLVAIEEVVCYDNIDFIDILATPCSKSTCLRALRTMLHYCFSMLLNQLPVEAQPSPLFAPPPVMSAIEWRIVCTALSLLEKFAADSHFKTFFSSAITQPMLLFLVCVVAPMEERDVEVILASNDDHSMRAVFYAVVVIMGCLHHFNVRLSGRNDDPLLFVKVLQRQLAGMAAADAVAPARLFSAMRNLAAFANDARSGIVADDADLFCKLQSELQRGSTVVAASSVAAAPTKVPRDIGGLPAES